MIFLNGITILLIYQLIGEFSVHLLRIPVPGPVLGMILLFLTLLIVRNTAASLHSASSALLSHLSLLFVPAGVGITIHFGRIIHEGIPIAVTLVASTVMTMAATALIMLWTNNLLTKRSERNG